MVLGIDPKVDYVFKRVFGDERNADILVAFLNAILRLADPIVSIEILNPFNDKDFSEDKLTILDIKARDQLGRLIDIEMQVLLPHHLPSRVLYYWASLYREQLAEGDRYGRLRPTISICLLNQQMFPDVDDYHLAFGLLNLEHGVCFSEHIQVHVLELPKFRRPLDQLQDPLDKWLYLLQNAESMDPDQLPGELQEPAIRHAMKEFEVLTHSQLERERYESRLKAIRDEMDRLDGARDEGRDEGREEGREEGRQEGRQEGKLIGRIQAYEEQLGRPLTPDVVLAARSLEELQQRAQELKAELE